MALHRVPHVLVLCALLLILDAHAVAQGKMSSRNGKRQQETPSPQRGTIDSLPVLDVPYVSTPHKVVAAMLKMARVKKGDLVYDLGCGDGRIVIAAARDFGARGVGIDLDPKRIQEARENARKASVEDRVTFIEQDLFDADVRKASVVTLYLFSGVNLRLRPKLLRELRPGTRVVSHSFDMGDWRPVRVENIDDHKIYYWVIPGKKEGKAK